MSREDVGFGAEASADLDFHRNGFADRSNGISVMSLALKGSIKVYDVKSFGSGVLKRFSLSGGIIGINRFGIRLAPPEAHDLAAHEVDGGDG